MKQIYLPGTNILLSRFALGTASLHHIVSVQDQTKLLAAAVEHGFTHFDTAPLYGFGQAERALAPILATHPELTVATKAGLYPPGGAVQSGSALFARKLIGKLVPKLSRAIVDFAVNRARESLSASLSRLGRERIDIFFLHEPERELVATDEWLRWLEEEKQRVASFGIAGGMRQLMPFLAEENPLANIVQTADSLDHKEAEPILMAGRPLQLTYGYFSAATRSSGGDAQTVLRGALERNKTGAILVSTRRVSRLTQYALAAEEEVAE